MDDLQIHSNEAPIRSTPGSKAAILELDAIGNTELSFRIVKPAALSVEGLNLHIETASSALDRLRYRFAKGTNADIRQKSQRKTILRDITAHMPSGSLTAIIGASGSGKTSLFPNCHTVMSVLNHLQVLPRCHLTPGPGPSIQDLWKHFVQR